MKDVRRQAGALFLFLAGWVPAAGADGVLSGTVKDALTGAPLPDVLVRVWDCRGASVASASTNGLGVFTADALPPGAYLAGTDNESGYIDQIYKGRECAGYCDPILGTPITVSDGATTSVVLALRRGGRIAGLVTGPAGPVPEVTISVYNERAELVTYAYTGLDGRYVTPAGLPTGAYFLKTQNRVHLLEQMYGGTECPCGRCDILRATPVVVAAPATVSGVDFTLAAGGVISGRVVDASTALPLSGWAFISNARGSCTFGRLDAGGRYTSESGLPSGDYFVKTRADGNYLDQTYDGVACPGVPPLGPTPVTVTAPDTRSGIDFRLGAGGSITGTVRQAPGGAALAGAFVEAAASPGDSFINGGTSDAAGAYGVYRLCPGPYHARASGPDGSGFVRQLYSGIPCPACSASLGLPITVAPAPAVTAGVDFLLQPGGRIAGTLFDAATGEPRKGVSVTVYDVTGAFIGTAKTDCQQGSYVAPEDEGLPTADYFVTSGSSPYMPYPYGYRMQLFSLRECLFCDVTLGDKVPVLAPLTTPGTHFRLIRSRRNGDYDRDGRSDIAIHQPATATWRVRSASGATTTTVFGSPGWQAVPGDYDNDGKTDLAVSNPPGWLVRHSSTGLDRTYTGVGGAGDLPARADYDGDGRTDVAAYHPATGLWTIRWSTTGAIATVGLGGIREVPVPADYDGDRQVDVAVFNIDTGVWTIRHSGSLRVETFTFGRAGLLPVPFDFDGDGRADPATFQPSTGLWNILQSASGSLKNFVLGDAASLPVPLDYDGDGKTDAAVYHQVTHHWRIRLATEAVLDLPYAPGTPLN